MYEMITKMDSFIVNGVGRFALGAFAVNRIFEGEQPILWLFLAPYFLLSSAFVLFSGVPVMFSHICKYMCGSRR